MRRVFRPLLLVCFLLCMLSSCGFHLRGKVPLAPPLYSLYLQTPAPYGQLARNIRQYLKMSDVSLASSPEKADTVLIIVREDSTDQLLSVGGTQQTRQYNLILTVAFEVRDPQGHVLVPKQFVSVTRAITIESDQILGGSNEENNMYKQMREAIVYNIMGRLASRDITAMLMLNKTRLATHEN